MLEGLIVRPSDRANFEHGLAKFDWFSALNQDLSHHPAHLGLDFVHYFHGFDNADYGVRIYLRAHFHVIGGFRGGSAVEGTNHGGFNLEFTCRGSRSGRRWSRVSEGGRLSRTTRREVILNRFFVGAS